MTRVARRAASGLIVLAGTIAAIVVVWTAFLAVVDVSEFVAKSPLDVANYLAEAANRAAMWPLLGRTLADAALGFTAGLALSTAIALVFYFSRTAERMFLPVLATLRAIPMVTVAPIIVLVFGREEAGTAVIGAAIVLVPAVLTMLHGVRSAPTAGLDLVRAYGGTSWTAFTKVALPHAAPTWFTAARISVTTAIVGALLAQWLASGAGLGGQMMRDANEFQFDRLWASVVVLTVVCVAVYQLLALAETAVQSRLRSTP